MYILGISCYYHDSAAALLRDGRIIAACAEERLSGQKHDSGFPENAIRYCLKEAGIEPSELDHVIFYDRPLLKFDRILCSLIKNAPFNYRQYISALPLWLRQKLWVEQRIKNHPGKLKNLWFSEHHLSHAAGAFFLSPFDKAAILTIDGVGEKTTASIGRGEDNRIELLMEMSYPDSVGLLYSAFTYFLGFRVNSGEYKVMGLAPYGLPRYADLIRDRLVKIFDDGSIRLNLKMFNFPRGMTMTSSRFEKLFGTARRQPGKLLEDIHRDIAASIQEITEEIIFKMAEEAKKQTGLDNLVMSGGVALNCRAAGLLRQSGMFRDIFVQPAAGDDGGAAGAAFFLYHHILGHQRDHHDNIISLGPAVDIEDIREICRKHRIPHRTIADADESARILALALAQGKIIGLVSGRSEYGPRALGHRSILANPADPAMKEKINAAVKFREPFRPFAPAVIEEKADEYFDTRGNSPYMTFLFNVREEKKKKIPAVTHVDGTSRIQTVSRKTNPLLYGILQQFENLTSLPALLNTSYNLRGFPISATARQTLQTFFSSGIDILLVENILLDKKMIPRPYPVELTIKPLED